MSSTEHQYLWMFNETITNGTNTTGYSNFSEPFVDEDGVLITDIPYDKSDDIFNDKHNIRLGSIEAQYVFILFYGIVFCCCTVGNLVVILVVIFSRRLRSITNFFLANLAVADFCVGIFCVLQNLFIFLMDSWLLGEFLCKMYHFVHTLSHTASIFILVVICIERYCAIIHPITCKQILTPRRLRLIIGAVWLTAALYATPKYFYGFLITTTLPNGKNENLCILDRKRHDNKITDLVHFCLLYVLPLMVMMVLYSRIAITLWKSSRGLEKPAPIRQTQSMTPGFNNRLLRHSSNKYERRGNGAAESQVSMESDSVIVTTVRTPSAYYHHRHGTQLAQISHSTNNVLRARRGVIRMLIIVVMTFALCNLPYHAKKLWQNWSSTFNSDVRFNPILTPLTFLIVYMNSGINPLLYAFLSRNFRRGMRELFNYCSMKRTTSAMSQHQRAPVHNNSLPTDSTHLGNQL